MAMDITGSQGVARRWPRREGGKIQAAETKSAEDSRPEFYEDAIDLSDVRDRSGPLLILVEASP